MVSRSADFAVGATGGELLSVRGDRRWKGAALDSRKVAGDEIFFALEGQERNGHEFVEAALGTGAAFAVVHREVAEGLPALRVEDTYRALHDLTRAVRDEVPERLVAITGSVGKTTTKELLADLLARRFRVGRSPGNLNNLYGFPLALLGLEEPCEWMVAEMGMSTPGELAGVSRLGRPDVAMLLSVRAAHLENFDDLRGIADAKAEILAGLARDGIFVANGDDGEVVRIARRWSETNPQGRLVLYGTDESAEIRLLDLRPHPEARWGSRFRIEAGGESADFELPLYGLYNAENALAATAVAWTLGVPLEECAAAARGFRASRMRGEVHRLAGGTVVVDDSYNSNPSAAQRSLESAARMPAGRHLAVLGDMLELGPRAPELHRELGETAARLGFELVVGVGALSRDTVAAVRRAGTEAIWTEDAASALGELQSRLRTDDVVLVKGSRSIGLEKVVEGLLAEQGAEVGC